MGAKILLLTEDTENMAKLEMALSRFGFTILSALKLPQAMDILNADSTVDMVVSDLKLSWGDSFDLLKRVRADHLLSDIPFVFLVQEEGDLTDAMRRAASIYGADKFLFMNEFEPHRFRYELGALLPEQETEPTPDLVPPMDIQPEPGTGT